VTLAMTASPLAVGVSVAQGPTAPPWESDANAGNPFANLLFFDAQGNQVTSGTNDLSAPFAYAVATTDDGLGSTKAYLYFANPQPGSPPVPGDWTQQAAGGPTTFSPPSLLPAGTPADVVADAASVPVVASSAQTDITTWLNNNHPSTVAGYANTIEVRLVDSANLGTLIYWDSDIGYNTTSSPITVDGTTVPANGWAQLFPFVTTTTTSLTATPASPRVTGTKVTLKATVTPAEAGTVQFYDGTTTLGSPITVAAGVASKKITPAVGAHSFSGVFLPTIGDETNLNTNNATIVGESTSNTVAYTVDVAPTVTKLSPVKLAVGGKGTFTLTGTGFQTGAKLSFSPTGVKPSSLKVSSATTITATFTAPTGTALGAVTVKVTNPDAGTASCASCLTVIAAPTLTNISPPSVADGAVVSATITGTGFATGAKLTGPTGVTFSSVKVVNSTTITATMTVSATAPTGTNLPVTEKNSGTAGYGTATGDVLTVT
jgi:hypothetical protein